MKRLTKRQAIAAIKRGKTVTLCPSKCSPLSMFAHTIYSKLFQDSAEFEKLLNSFSYYNCNQETGQRIHYYES